MAVSSSTRTGERDAPPSFVIPQKVLIQVDGDERKTGVLHSKHRLERQKSRDVRICLCTLMCLMCTPRPFYVPNGALEGLLVVLAYVWWVLQDF